MSHSRKALYYIICDQHLQEDTDQPVHSHRPFRRLCGPMLEKYNHNTYCVIGINHAHMQVLPNRATPNAHISLGTDFLCMWLTHVPSLLPLLVKATASF